MWGATGDSKRDSDFLHRLRHDADIYSSPVAQAITEGMTLPSRDAAVALYDLPLLRV